MNAGYEAISEKSRADIFRAFRTFRGQYVTSVKKEHHEGYEGEENVKLRVLRVFVVKNSIAD